MERVLISTEPKEDPAPNLRLLYFSCILTLITNFLLYAFLIDDMTLEQVVLGLPVLLGETWLAMYVLSENKRDEESKGRRLALFLSKLYICSFVILLFVAVVKFTAAVTQAEMMLALMIFLLDLFGIGPAAMLGATYLMNKPNPVPPTPERV